MEELLISCLLVFVARVLDVTLGTLRIMFISKGKRLITFVVAFVEVMLWFMVARTALTTDAHLLVGVSYALGYATGTFLGITITSNLSMGNLGIQVITSNKDKNLIESLRNEGYALSVIDIKGKDDLEKHMLFIEIKKKNYDHLIKEINRLDPQAFIVANETKYVLNGFIK